MNIRRHILCILLPVVAFAALGADHPVVKPDMDLIKKETTTPSSRYYYPRLLKSFMSNDTVMTLDDYRYFYYGTIFQEDYDPYRKPIDPDTLSAIEPLYYKEKHTNAERSRIEEYAKRAVADNPLDLPQLSKLVYVYEKKGKVNLAKIWKSKLNNILHVIAQSGTGESPETAFVVALPRHEYDLLNLQGLKADAQRFEPPYYEYISVARKSDKDPEGYYFDIHAILEQYYLKHPSEMGVE